MPFVLGFSGRVSNLKGGTVMFLRDNSTCNYVIDTEPSQRLVLKAGAAEFAVFETVIDVPSLWFRTTLEGENEETCLRSIEFSASGLNVGYTVDYVKRYLVDKREDLTPQCRAIAERKSRRVTHKRMPFLAPSEMKERYFLLGVTVVDSDGEAKEEYQVVFNHTCYCIFVVNGSGATTGTTGAYGEPEAEYYVEKAQTERRFIGYRAWETAAV